jgi:hypothetical protein
MSTLAIISIATAAFVGVAAFFAFGVRKMQTVDAARTSGALPMGGNRLMTPMVAGFDGGGSTSCGDGGGGCS